MLQSFMLDLPSADRTPFGAGDNQLPASVACQLGRGVSKHHRPQHALAVCIDGTNRKANRLGEQFSVEQAAKALHQSEEAND